MTIRNGFLMMTAGMILAGALSVSAQDQVPQGHKLEGAELRAVHALVSGANLAPTITPTQTPQVNSGGAIFPGIIRQEENGRIMVGLDRVVAGTTYVAKVNVLDGGFTSAAYTFDQSFVGQPGSFATTFEVPSISNGYIDVTIEVSEIRNGSVISRTQLIQSSSYKPPLIVAAYETQIPSPIGGNSQTGLKFAGTFDPSQPGSIYIGDYKITVKVLGRSASNTPQETIIAIGDDIPRTNSYTITVNQNGICKTVKVDRLYIDARG